MLLLGLTGSIATGKSTVSSLLSDPPYSLPVIDADVLARKAVEPGSASYRKILQHFSSTIPDLLMEHSLAMPEHGLDGRGRPLNRAALGRRVFGEGEARKRDRAILNNIVHPAVRREMLKAVISVYLHGHWAVVLDVPLLFESNLDRFCGVAMVVAVTNLQVQINRLMARDPQLSHTEARDRVQSQVDVRLKVARCAARGEGSGIVVWNDGTREELTRRLHSVMAELRRAHPDWWTRVLLVCPLLAVVLAAWSIRQNTRSNAQWTDTQSKNDAKTKL